MPQDNVPNKTTEAKWGGLPIRSTELPLHQLLACGHKEDADLAVAPPCSVRFAGKHRSVMAKQEEVQPSPWTQLASPFHLPQGQ